VATLTAAPGIVGDSGVDGNLAAVTSVFGTGCAATDSLADSTVARGVRAALPAAALPGVRA
jgi:hypothetical protein